MLGLLIQLPHHKLHSASLDAVHLHAQVATEFVAYFQWFDARSKQQTDEIPLVDLDEVDEVIREYFPDGMLVW